MSRVAPKIVSSERGLIVVIAVAGATLVAELLWPFSLDTTEPMSESVAHVPIARPASHGRPTIDKQHYGLIAEQPLFTLDRRPYKPPREAPVQAPPPDPQPMIEFGLNAVVTTAQNRVALLHPGRSNELVKLSLGDSHEGWTLTEVKTNSVVLTNGGRTMTVSLKDEDRARRDRR